MVQKEVQKEDKEEKEVQKEVQKEDKEEKEVQKKVQKAGPKHGWRDRVRRWRDMMAVFDREKSQAEQDLVARVPTKTLEGWRSRLLQRAPAYTTTELLAQYRKSLKNWGDPDSVSGHRQATRARRKEKRQDKAPIAKLNSWRMKVAITTPCEIN